jgi:hypothetical protein
MQGLDFDKAKSKMYPARRFWKSRGLDLKKWDYSLTEVFV